MTIARAWRAIAQGRIPDIAELRAAREVMDPADENAAALKLALGVALGLRSQTSGSVRDRREAMDCYLEGLEGATGDAPWRYLGLKFFAAYLGASGYLDPNAIPAGRVLALAEKGITESAGRGQAAGIYHMIAFIARQALAVRDRPATDGAMLDDLNQARQLLSGDADLRMTLDALSASYYHERAKDSGSVQDYDDAVAIAAQATQNPMFKRLLEHPDLPDLFGQRLTMFDPATLDRLRDLATKKGASGFGFSDRNDLIEASAIADRLRVELRDHVGLSEDAPMYRSMSQLSATMQATLGAQTGDVPAIDAAISQLKASLPPSGRASSGPGLWARAMIGTLLRYRFAMNRNRRDLDEGISVLEEARRELGAGPTDLGALVLWQLAESYRVRNDASHDDRQRSIETGMLAQSERAAEVLLQSGTENGLKTARTSVQAATRLACWCLEDGRIDEAIQALEQGRALILHLTTVAPDIPGLLHSADRGDLAQAWVKAQAAVKTQATQGRNDLAIPADTRREVLDVLKTAGPDGDLLTPPQLTELRAGIGAAGYDALVYLIPPELQLGPDIVLPPDLRLSPALQLPPGLLIPGGLPRPDPALLGPGLALLVTAGAVHTVPLPDLTEQWLAGYDQAHLATITDPRDEAARQHWEAALTELCGRAWDAVMSPVLDYVAGWHLGRLPRLVLVPTGKLGAVAWHAARTRLDDGRPRYAIEDALICYAASARQLATASRRERRKPAEQPVLVSNPTGDLPLARHEGRALRQLYPDAEVFGALGDDRVTGPGTPQEILARLPGGSFGQASMLHFGGHATVGASLAESRLLLAGDQPLTIAEIAAQAQGRDPRAPGFLAVLGACLTDLANTDHDEALTLASALLAVGASGVIGTRWPTDDLASSELLVMFHHYLSDDAAMMPAEALRSAQLWMLDPDRQAPAGLAQRLARHATRPELADIAAWAGFTYQGAR